MGYQPIWDAEFDVVLASNGSEHADFLEGIFRHKLFLVNYINNGPGGDNPCIIVRGTKRQIMAWATENVFDTSSGETMDDRWNDMNVTGMITCIA